jgi:hypothetical protein
LKRKFPIRIFITLCFVISLVPGIVSAQYKVKGTVYDSSMIYRIQSVTVMATNGHITMTDTMGHYQIDVGEKDSIWFSFLGKTTPKYAVLKMADVNQFNLALHLKNDVMKEVTIRSHSYRMDSIQNRKDYAKIFNYQKVSVGSMTTVGPSGGAIDLDELIRLFQFKKNKATLRFQQRLLEQEREKFIDHRFNKALIHRLTTLDGEDLERFMVKYRPAYEFALLSSDYDFQFYIKTAYQQFSRAAAF